MFQLPSVLAFDCSLHIQRVAVCAVDFLVSTSCHHMNDALFATLRIRVSLKQFDTITLGLLARMM